MSKKTQNLNIGLSLGIIAVGLAFIIGTLATISRPESQLYPIFLGGVLVVLALINLLLDLRKFRALAAEGGPEKFDPKPDFVWWKTLILMVVYAASVWLFGFVIASWACTFYCYWILSEKRNKIVLFAFPTAFSISVFVIFTQVFNVRLPIGLLIGLLFN